MHKYWLWSSSRIKWVKRPKIKGCLFCRIAKDDPKVPKKVLHKDNAMMVIMNLFPYNTGHLEIVPIRHVEWLEDLNKQEFDELFKMLKKSIKLLKRTLRPTGFNIGLNLGEVAGASVPHLHIHVVPRYQRDFGFMEITAKTKVMPETIDETFKKLKRWVKILKE